MSKTWTSRPAVQVLLHSLYIDPAMHEVSSKILVVIPTLNEENTIETTLGSLLEGFSGDHMVRFVVSDGGSSDGTCNKVRELCSEHPNLHLVNNPKRVQSVAVNTAVKRFGGSSDILVRCDAHSIYPPGFIDSLVDSMDRNSADSVVVPMDSIGDTCLRRAIAWISDTPLGSGGSAHRGGQASGFVDHGHHAAFRVNRFREVGGYDPTFTHNEDAELDCRLRSQGSRIFLDAGIRIRYFPRPTLRGLWMQYFSYGRGRSRTVRKHPGSMRLRQVVVPTFIAATGISLVASFWNLAALLLPLIYFGALTGASGFLALKHRSWCGLLGGPAAFTMHTAWAAGFFHGLLTVRQERWSSESAHSPQAQTLTNHPS